MICPSCGKGCLSPILKPTPFLIIKESVTQNEIDTGTPFIQKTKNKWGYDEFTSNYYLNRELGRVGLSLSLFSCTSLYMHIPPAGKKTKEQKEVQQACTQFSIDNVVEIAKDKKIILLMGAEAIRTFTGYGSSDVYGLICKSELLPNVPVIIPTLNSDKLMSQPVGELRNALKVMAEQIETYKFFSKI